MTQLPQPEGLDAYLSASSSPASALLEQVERESHLLTTQGHMVSGHVQGRLLSLISKLVRPRLAVDVGTFTGYSALCLAEGLAAGGKVVTIDISPEHRTKAEGYFRQAGLQQVIELHTADAKEVIPALQAPIDLLFIDAAKQEYGTYLNLAWPKMPSGAVALVDNVLWKGRVLQEKKDARSKEIDAFNRYLQGMPQADVVMLPLRDGVTLVRKT